MVKRTNTGTMYRQALQGMSFGWGDEIDDRLNALEGKFQGKKYGEELKRLRTKTNQEIATDWEEAPVLSVTSNVAGSLPFALSSPAASISNWARASSLLGALGKGAAVGGGYGALAGAGAANPDPDSTLYEALLTRANGAGWGTAFGGVLGALGGALGRYFTPPDGTDFSEVGKTVSKQQPSKAQKMIAEQLGARPDLQEQLARAEAMNTASANTGIQLTLAEKIAQSQSDPMLAQQKILAQNPQTAGAMEALYAARSGTPNQAGSIEQALTGKARELAPNVGSYDEAAGALINSAETAKTALNKSLQEKAGPLYSEAFAANQSVDSPAIERILQTPMGQEAFKRARVTMQNNMKLLGKSDQELTALAAESGIKTGKGVAAGLKLEFLDTVKKELDAIYKIAERQGDISAMRSASDLSSSLLRELDAADVTALAGPNSLKPEGGLYSQARKTYSGNPDILQARENLGSLADIDPMNAKAVGRSLYSGTQQNAEMAAKNLGPEGSKVAAAARIYDVMDTARGDPTSFAGKIAPDARTADMLRTYAGGNTLDETLNVINQAKIGEKFRYGSPTQPLQEASAGMKEAAGGVIDLAVGNKVGLLRKVAGYLGVKEDPRFYQDMLELMTTEKGMELVRQVANQQGTAVQKQEAGKALITALQNKTALVGQPVRNSLVLGMNAPQASSPVFTPAAANPYMLPQQNNPYMEAR